MKTIMLMVVVMMSMFMSSTLSNFTEADLPTTSSTRKVEDAFAKEVRNCRSEYEDWAETHQGPEKKLKCCEVLLSNACMQHKCNTTLRKWNFTECDDQDQHFFPIDEKCAKYKLSAAKCTKTYPKMIDWVLIGVGVVLFLGITGISAILCRLRRDHGSGHRSHSHRHESEVVPASTVFDSKAGDNQKASTALTSAIDSCAVGSSNYSSSNCSSSMAYSSSAASSTASSVAPSEASKSAAGGEKNSVKTDLVKVKKNIKDTKDSTPSFKKRQKKVTSMIDEYNQLTRSKLIRAVMK